MDQIMVGVLELYSNIGGEPFAEGFRLGNTWSD